MGKLEPPPLHLPPLFIKMSRVSTAALSGTFKFGVLVRFSEAACPYRINKVFVRSNSRRHEEHGTFCCEHGESDPGAVPVSDLRAAELTMV